ncbi:DUF983 domain-containing protein [Xanthobacter sp. V3C-3]|uniref:DUF983 domain-containing protein n=1 Tax=Xanthobacter lutulentifluminis TaxID=3119935 RepID=UPI00372AE70D
MPVEPYYEPVSPLAAGLGCKCPRCGRGPLFKGFLDLAPSCTACGLDYGFADSGDGPAVFVILFAGLVVVAGAFWVEAAYEPPLWVHALLWVPAVLIVTLGLLRPLKAMMVSLQYRHKAAEGRLDQRAP